MSFIKDKIVKPLVKITVTGFALYYVFSKIDLDSFKLKLLSTNLFYIVLAIVLFAISQAVNSFRLLSIFEGMGFKLDKKYNLKLYSLGLFYNLFLPGGIGGDGYKIYILKKQFKQPTKKLFWAVFLDRLSGLWALTVLSTILCHFINAKPLFVQSIDIGIVLGSIIYYFVYKRFYPSYFSSFWKAHSLAILTQLLVAFSAACILSGMGVADRYAHYLTVFLLSSLAAIVPISVGGLGIREAMLLYGAKHLILDNSTAVSLSLLFYMVSALVSLVGIYFVFFDKSFSKFSLEQAEEEQEKSER